MKQLVKSILSIGMCFFCFCTASISMAAPQGKTTFGLKPFAEKQTLRVGFFVGGPLGMPFYVAEKEGFFKELNIEVVYETFTNGPAMMEANSTWDIASTGSGGILSGILGYDVRMIGLGEYEKNNALFVRAGSALAKDPKNPSNWKGSTWLYPMGTTAQAVLAAGLTQVGLNISDVKSINMDVSSALTGFVGKQGDGLAVYNTIAFMAEDKGFIRVGDSGSYNVVAPMAVMATKPAIAKKKELIATAYAVFYLTGEWIKSSPENMKKAAQYLLKSSQDEGISSTQSIAMRSIEWFNPLPLSKSIEVMTVTSPDATGTYTKRPLSQAEKDVTMSMMDFYISQKKYTTNDRTKVLDTQGIDPVIAIEVKKLMEASGAKM